jgi:N6-L-threonylcarbamoyladenine synthase
MSDNRDIIILAIETSCDETAAAIVRNGLEPLSNIVASQIDWHRKFGGVVPEIASRKHLEFINIVINEAMKKAGVKFNELDAIASTYGPGLIGSLLVGLSSAKAIAYVLSKPFIGVNHIVGHIYANFISNKEIEVPLICLTISGGHSDLIYFEDLGNFKILGRTKDDAAGEAFDKIARVLGLGYPGGPAIERKAENGNPEAIQFPRPFINRDNYDFSFSGLKTAVLNYLHNQKQKCKEINIADVAASFQKAVFDILISKVMKSIDNYPVKSIILSGGVAANKLLRKRFENELKSIALPLYYPELSLCTDNAAMIGAAAYYQYLKNDFSPLSLNAEANLQL